VKTAPLVLACLLVLLAACQSPLDIDTPRDRSTDSSAVPGDTATYAPMAIVFVLDASGSMQGVGNDAAKAATLLFIDSLNFMRDRAAVIFFNQTAWIARAMTAERDSLRNTVGLLPASGTTAVWDGIWAGLQELNGIDSTVTRAVVVLCDGLDNSSAHSPVNIQTLAVRNRIPVFILYLTTDVDDPAYQAVAAATGGTYVHVYSVQDTKAEFLLALKALRQ
jgi:Mg-chelatase subunit ChlD